MAEILPRHYIIAIMLFTVVIVGGVSLITEFQKSDDSFIDQEKYDDFNKTFNKYEDIIEISNNTQRNIENMENSEFGIFGVLGSLVNQAWQFLRLTISSLDFMNSAFLGVSKIFGVPIWIPTILIAIIVILIGFAIYSAIFQREI